MKKGSLEYPHYWSNFQLQFIIYDFFAVQQYWYWKPPPGHRLYIRISNIIHISTCRVWNLGMLADEIITELKLYGDI
jgi:hypothetical protein